MKKDLQLTCGTNVKALEKLLRGDEYIQIHRRSQYTNEPVYPPHLFPESLSPLRRLQSRTSRLVVIATETRLDNEGISHQHSPFAWVDEYSYIVLKRDKIFQITPFNELPHRLRPDQQIKLVQDVECITGRTVDTRKESVRTLPRTQQIQSVQET